MEKNKGSGLDLVGMMEDPSLDKLGFDQARLDQQRKDGVIDVADYKFLSNVLKVAGKDPVVLKRILEARIALTNGPQARNLSQAQADALFGLGAKHFPGDLRITGLKFKDLNMEQAVIGGDFNAENVQIKGDFYADNLSVKQTVNQRGMKVGGDVHQNEMMADALLQDGMMVEHSNAQANLKVRVLTQNRMTVGDENVQDGLEASEVSQVAMKVGNECYQRNMRIGEVLAQGGIETGVTLQHGTEIAGKTMVEYEKLLEKAQKEEKKSRKSKGEILINDDGAVTRTKRTITDRFIAFFSKEKNVSAIQDRWDRMG